MGHVNPKGDVGDPVSAVELQCRQSLESVAVSTPGHRDGLNTNCGG